MINLSLFVAGSWIACGLFACWSQNVWRGKKEGVKYALAIEDIATYALMGPIAIDLFRRPK
jgi:hypothetical protein